LSALLGRIPSETGYQPTLTTEIGQLHERIRSRGGSSITAVEAVYLPADDLTDPAVVAIFAHLDSILVLSRLSVQRGLYPAINPLESSSGFLSPQLIGKRHFATAQGVWRHVQKYDELQRIVAIIGKEELSRADRLVFDRARKLQHFLSQPFFTAELHTGRQGRYVTLEDTISGCEQIMGGACDGVADDRLYMIGSLAEAIPQPS
jgi:F-type H+-transporting ATPase subunit beta